MDDGPRVCATIELVGCAFFAVLDILDKSGYLTRHSKFRDLGLVMSLYIVWSSCLPEFGIGEDGELDWGEDVVAFAEKASIDLSATGCYATCQTLKDFDKTNKKKRRRIRTSKWNWTRKVSLHMYFYT